MPDRRDAPPGRLWLRLRRAAEAALCLLAPLTATAAPGVKPPLAGLISMGRPGFAPENNNASFDGIPGTTMADVTARRNAFDGVVINVPWSALQPQGPDGLDSRPIDSALDEIRRYNADPATTRKLRGLLRVFGGFVAPDWAQALDGGPMLIDRHMHGRFDQKSMGRFWAAAYRQAWRGLQAKLAARYDTEPLIAQVSNTSCASTDAEPYSIPRWFDRATGSSAIRTMHQHGYSDALMLRCLSDSPADYDAWRLTNIDLTFNAFFRTDANEYRVPPKDFDATLDMMRMWRAHFGARAVLANHNLAFPILPQFVPIYRAMRDMGGQIEFQTHSPKDLDWDTTMKLAACIGAQAVEIWNATPEGGYLDFPTSRLIAWSELLRLRQPNEICTQF